MAALKRRGIPRWVSRALAVNTKISVTCGQAGPYTSYIEDVNPGKTLTIAAPIPGGTPLAVGKGELLKVEIVAPQGVARFFSEVLGHANTPAPVLIVSYPTPDGLEIIQRRRSVRVPVLLPLKCRKIKDKGGEAASEPPVEGLALNLSAKGLKMVAPPVFEVGDQVQMCIAFPWGEETLTGQVVVRFTPLEEEGENEEEDEPGDSPGRAEDAEPAGEDEQGAAVGPVEAKRKKKGGPGPAGDEKPKRVAYGVEFLNVEEPLEEKIYRYLFERQAELRRKGTV